MERNGATAAAFAHHMGNNRSKAPELKSTNDAEYWCQLAAETRKMARHIGLADAKRRMQAIADEYERRAEHAKRKFKQNAGCL